MSLFGFEVATPVVLLGAIIGMTYGVLAVGLVLVYRTSRVINFAHGEVGAFAGAVFGLAATRWRIPYYLALVGALAVGGAVGALVELTVVRRLRAYPRVMTIVATLGVAQFLLAFSLVVNAQASAGAIYPQPPGVPVFDVGALRVTPAYSGMLVLTPLLVAAVTGFLARSRAGLALRAAAADVELARLAAVPAARMSSLAWAIAGALSAFTAVLTAPTRGFVTVESFGPSLLLRALVAAVVARMTSLPVALAAGVSVGVVEQLLLWNHPRGGLVEAMLFALILVALLTQRRLGGREDERGTWAAVRPWPRLPEPYRRLVTVRALPWVLAAVAFGAAVALPLAISHSASILLVGVVAFSIVGLSVGIITGLAGQLSLGQFALAAIGAVVSYHVSLRSGNFVLAFVCAAVAAGAASLVIGLPALRIRGLLLAVTTLSFALVTSAWLLQQPWMVGEGVDPGRPIVAGYPLTSGKSYYLLSVGVLAVMLLLVRNIWRSGIARRFVAVRDNEDAARAFGLSAAAVKIQAFVLAGAVAGIGGAVYGHALSRIGPSAFPVAASIDVVAMAVIGGLGVLVGPLLGALYIIGVPSFVPLDTAGLAATALGWLLLILYVPGGLAQLARPLRDRLVALLARGAELPEPVSVRLAEQPAARAPAIAFTSTPARPNADTVLRGENLAKSYGGVRALDGVSVTVRGGETVGLIGPNGAGKTTLFELLGGFTRPDSGTVLFDGYDVSRRAADERARLGLVRSFQDAALFPTMTVHDAVLVALERTMPTPLVPALVGARKLERRRDARAREVIALFGLDSYRDVAVADLSTGTRRIVELACAVALEPIALLLDEPSSGIAQRESEALGVLLADLRSQLGLTLVVIEHNLPLVSALADRLVAMDAGRVIAEGAPASVLADPVVGEAYLGAPRTTEAPCASPPPAAGPAPLT